MREPFVTPALWLLILDLMRDVLLQIIFPRQGFWQKAFKSPQLNVETPKTWKRRKCDTTRLSHPPCKIGNETRRLFKRDESRNMCWATLVLSTRCSPDPSLSCFWVAIVSVLISSCSATLGTLVSELSLGAGLGSWLTWEWSVACDQWPVLRGSVWSGARWTPGPGPASVTSLRWEQQAGATFRAQSRSITLQPNNYHNTIPRSRTSAMINQIVLTHWVSQVTSLQNCDILKKHIKSSKIYSCIVWVVHHRIFSYSASALNKIRKIYQICLYIELCISI